MNEQKLKFAMVVGSLVLFNVAVVIGFQHQFRLVEAKTAKATAQSASTSPVPAAQIASAAAAEIGAPIPTECPIPRIPAPRSTTTRARIPAPADMIRLVPPPPPVNYTSSYERPHHYKARKRNDIPTLLAKLKVAAIIGDKTILEVPGMIRLQRRWPATLTLGPGDRFEEISVISIDDDKVTLEEHGKRAVLSLPTCR